MGFGTLWSRPFPWLLLAVLLAPPGVGLALVLLLFFLLPLLAYRLTVHPPKGEEVREALAFVSPFWPLVLLEWAQLLFPYPLLQEGRGWPHLPLTGVVLVLLVHRLTEVRAPGGQAYWVTLGLLAGVLGAVEVLTGVAFFPHPVRLDGPEQNPLSLFGGRGYWSAFLALALPLVLAGGRIREGVFLSFLLGLGTVRPALLSAILAGVLSGRGWRQKLLWGLLMGLGFSGGYLLGIKAPSLWAGGEGGSLEAHVGRDTFSTRLVIWKGVLRDLSWRPWLGWGGQPTSGLYPHYMTEEEFAAFYAREFGAPLSERGYYVWTPAPGRTWGLALKEVKEEGEEGKGNPWKGIDVLPPMPAHNLFLHFFGAYGVLGGAYFLVRYLQAAGRGGPMGHALLALFPVALFWHPSSKVLLFLFLVLGEALAQKKSQGG